MRNPDIWLPVCVGILTFALAIMGVVVTLIPPSTTQAKIAWGVAFFVVAILGCILIWWQAERSVDAQQELKNEIKNNKPPTAEENAKALLALQDAREVQQPTAPKPFSPRKPDKSLSVPPQVARFMINQTPEPSDSSESPHKTRVVVQTNEVFPSLRIAVKCDGPITKGSGGASGMFTGMNRGVVSGDANTFVYSYQSGTPPFGPGNPLIFHFWSKDEIHCERVVTF